MSAYVKNYEDFEIELKEASLLSRLEFKEFKDMIPPVSEKWWTLTPDSLENDRVMVVYGDKVFDESINVVIGVRPVLKIENKLKKIRPGQKFEFASYDWTLLKDDLALCDRVINISNFNDWTIRNNNVYQTSMLKEYIDRWFKNAISEKRVKGNIQIYNSPIRINGITLPDRADYEKYRELMPELDYMWLKSIPEFYGINTDVAEMVGYGRNITRCRTDFSWAVCPILIIEKDPNTFDVGDTFEFAGHQFKILSNEYAMCMDPIGESEFNHDWERSDSGDYARSDVKAFLEKWIEKELVLERAVTMLESGERFKDDDSLKEISDMLEGISKEYTVPQRQLTSIYQERLHINNTERNVFIEEPEIDENGEDYTQKEPVEEEHEMTLLERALRGDSLSADILEDFHGIDVGCSGYEDVEEKINMGLMDMITENESPQTEQIEQPQYTEGEPEIEEDLDIQLESVIIPQVIRSRDDDDDELVR